MRLADRYFRWLCLFIVVRAHRAAAVTGIVFSPRGKSKSERRDLSPLMWLSRREGILKKLFRR
jgi:hypothetical protein